eukprot:scaffold7452_cov254-Alexandrium_tamarense.AAC.2
MDGKSGKSTMGKSGKSHKPWDECTKTTWAPTFTPQPSTPWPTWFPTTSLQDPTAYPILRTSPTPIRYRAIEVVVIARTTVYTLGIHLNART